MTEGNAGGPAKFRFVGQPRRTKEDRRFVAGQGKYVADIRLPGMKHVALVSSPHASARILSIDTKAALALDGVRAVLTGDELKAATASMQHGVFLPKVAWYPLASGVVRYAGEWVAAVVADTRALAEDAAELVNVDYEPLSFVVDAEEAFAPDRPPVHPEHGSNVLLDRTFVWGPVEEDFAGRRAQPRFPRHAGAAIRRCRSRPSAWSPAGIRGEEILDVWASIQMPKYADQIAARAAACRQRGARAPRRRCRRQLRRQARHQAHGAGRLSGAAARLPGAADRGPAGEHARRRRARSGPHLRRRASPSTTTAPCAR